MAVGKRAKTTTIMPKLELANIKPLPDYETLGNNASVDGSVDSTNSDSDTARQTRSMRNKVYRVVVAEPKQKQSSFETLTDSLVQEEGDHLQIGDLIQMQMFMGTTVSKHWAVYVGELDDHRYIVSAHPGSLYSNGEVQLENFDTMQRTLRINNSIDLFAAPLNPKTIALNAIRRVGSRDHSSMSSNCEHFATRCRNEGARSLEMRILEIFWGWKASKAKPSAYIC
uniref:LRAT domain-containing protein n=1 Tax=Ditylenchus dipsaci TaxID=166011 RepID=A0A915EVA6_9BILA